jgi:tetratricopeptide (TPR) repeat protein
MRLMQAISKVRVFSPALALPILVIAIYWRGLYGGFIFDDFPNLVDDPDWKLTSFGWMNWVSAAFSGISSDLGRPLAMLSFAANYAVTGINPFYLKATNLGLHALNALLVFLLVREIQSRNIRDDGNHNIWFALLVATLWAVHPLQTSTVLYVVQRMELGAHTGVLIALVCYLRARQAPTILSSLIYAIACGLAILIGVGFKESAALTPVYLLLIELFILKFKRLDGGLSKPAALISSLFVLLGLTAAVLIAPHYMQPSAYATRDFTLEQRLWTQIDVLWMYIGQILVPRLDRFYFYYDNFQISDASFLTFCRGIALSALVLTSLILRKASPLIPLGITIFFAAHGLTSNIFPLELAFEHRNYFASFGMALATTALIARAAQHYSAGARAIAAAALITFLTGLTLLQSSIWGDPLHLSLTLESRNPGSPRAKHELALQMLRESKLDPASPLFSLARQELLLTSRLPSASPLSEQALVYIYETAGEQVPDSVWGSMRSKLVDRPAGAEELNALHGLITCAAAEVCKNSHQKILEVMIIAVRRNPQNPAILNLYSNFAYSIMRDYDLAIRVARECVALSPNNPQYATNLALMLTATGRDEEARVLMRKGVEARQWPLRASD